MKRSAKAGWLYLLEFGAATALLVVAFLVQKHMAGRVTGAAAIAFDLLPIAPIWAMFIAVLRYYRRVDEYQRLELLQSAAFAAGVAACLFTSYPFAAHAFGWQELSLGYAWPILAVAWGLSTAWTEFRNKQGRE